MNKWERKAVGVFLVVGIFGLFFFSNWNCECV